MNTKFLRATELMGKEIRNEVGEELGSLDSIMIDLKTGDIAYAVLSFKKYFGLEDKLFALPWKLLHIPNNDNCITVDITRERLNVMPGFNKHYWPNMEDPIWQSEIANYYHDYND